MVESALAREESRGAHYRSDFPDQDNENWLRMVRARASADGAEIVTRTEPVAFTRISPVGDPAHGEPG